MATEQLSGNRPYAYHLRMMNVNPIAPADVPAVDLPDTLIIPPGNYRVQGQTYALTEEGLYRFLCPLPLKDNQQRIVYAGDPVTLISSVCWLNTHGGRHDAVPNEALMEIAKMEKLIITCGKASLFCVYVLSQYGIPARMVQASTREEPNSYDMGHALMEAQVDGKWALFDIDAHVALRHNGKRLSLIEALEWIEKDDYDLEGLSHAVCTAIGSFSEDGYDYSLYMETNFSSEVLLRRWYRRVMQFPLMPNSDGGCCYPQSFAARLGSTALIALWQQRGINPIMALPDDEFARLFYSETVAGLPV